MQIIMHRLNNLRHDRQGLSNIIVVVLSLVIIVVIASNVVLWSYEMNQLDWEKMQESVSLVNVAPATCSSWFVTQNEYTVNRGTHTSGSYLDTQLIDTSYESFRESTVPRALDVNGTFSLDLSSCPLAFVQGIEIQLRYRVNDALERWFLEAYSWISKTYHDNDFNNSAGHTPNSDWNYYAVNIANKWRNYVNDQGKILVKIHDQGPDFIRTTIDVDFLAVRAVVDGTLFTFQNKGSRTVHLVSMWISNSTEHKRYDVDVYLNSGETFSYLRPDILLPSKEYIVKVVTERGNMAIYSGG